MAVSYNSTPVSFPTVTILSFPTDRIRKVLGRGSMLLAIISSLNNPWKARIIQEIKYSYRTNNID